MLHRLGALALFYRDCIRGFFRKGYRWHAGTPLLVLTRLVYYFCNWCYALFIYGAEALAFARERELKRVDKELFSHYFYPNQFWLALTEGLKIERPETLYRLTYGETTWFGIRAMLRDVNASSEDVFYDLGCGTGRNVFFARVMYGMRAVGLDLIGSFVRYGNQTVAATGLDKIEFIEQNIFTRDLSPATLVFITANCYDPETMGLLVKRLEDLQPGTRVISTHRPIPSPRMEQLGSRRLPFSWGVDWVYYQRVQAVPLV
ncbi:MAG: methyltransferase domain-containing protein [Candidatus Sericytochromatia bacterium]